MVRSCPAKLTGRLAVSGLQGSSVVSLPNCTSRQLSCGLHAARQLHNATAKIQGDAKAARTPVAAHAPRIT
jgi:hypothetical protein